MSVVFFFVHHPNTMIRPSNGRRVNVKNATALAGGNDVTLDPNSGAENIDKVSSLVFSELEAKSIQADGTEWWIMVS